VLVSGAGVAGPAMAYWLWRAGMTPVLVERAPEPRAGGYMIDFWGPGFEAAERMGLAARLREIGYRIDELRLVDANGRPNARLAVSAFSRILAGRYVSLLRSDLSAALLDVVRDHVEVRFDNTVAALSQRSDGVDVRFAGGAAERFDLVIGADGLHSNIRRLAFGDDPIQQQPMGYCVAAFTTRGYPHRDPSAYVSRTTPGRQVARYSLRDGRTTIFMILAADDALGLQNKSGGAQRDVLARAFKHIGWECDDILKALWRADDLYVDEVAQVRMPAWSSGRVALLGDAAWCPSLLAGEGASFAVAGALVLAGELLNAGGDHRPALEAFERRLRRYIEGKQRAALRMGSWFAPRTRLGIFIRDQLTRLAGAPGLTKLIAGPMVADGLALPHYDWLR
jgi:2-polyprenyl-6-methoxyphenol hydroxylase-like FAD-dependent oxidoreductase